MRFSILEHLKHTNVLEPDRRSKKLSIPERIALVEEIWDSIAEDNGCFELTEAQKQELDRRLEMFYANPSQGRTWEEIKRDVLNSK